MCSNDQLMLILQSVIFTETKKTRGYHKHVLPAEVGLYIEVSQTDRYTVKWHAKQ